MSDPVTLDELRAALADIPGQNLLVHWDEQSIDIQHTTQKVDIIAATRVDRKRFIRITRLRGDYMSCREYDDERKAFVPVHIPMESPDLQRVADIASAWLKHVRKLCGVRDGLVHLGSSRYDKRFPAPRGLLGTFDPTFPGLRVMAAVPFRRR